MTDDAKKLADIRECLAERYQAGGDPVEAVEYLLGEVDRLHKLTAALKCDRCGKPLEILGGLMFGPPLIGMGAGPMVVVKQHVCVDCWAVL